MTFRQNRVNDYILRAVVPVSTKKQEYIALVALHQSKIAFERRNVSNRSEITITFLQNRVNDCILRAAGPIATMKPACTTCGV